MTDLQATLDAIDELAVHECAHCSERLPVDSESLNYCDDECQAAWLSEQRQIVDLVGYREPDDLAAHAYNQVELRSPETTPAWAGWESEEWNTTTGSLAVRTHINAFSFARAIQEAQADWASAMLEYDLRGSVTMGRGVTADWVIIDEIHDWHPIGLINNTMRITTSDVARVFDVPEELITRCPEPFGSDFDFAWRPTPGLYGDLKPAVMSDLPERDWQALVDAHVPHTGPVRPVRAPRQLGRTRW